MTITMNEPQSSVAQPATATTPAVKRLSLKDISQLGYLQKTKEVYAGAVVTLQTLSISRQQKILSHLPADIMDPVVKFTHLQVETLANATLSINDEKYTENDVDRLREFYGGLQGKVLQEFFAVYQELVDEQDITLTGLKKT